MPELLVPKLNNQDADYVLTDWLVGDGTPVRAGDPVAVVETSKAAEELEADATGVLTHHLPAGARCRPGEPIALIGEEAAVAAEPAGGPPAAPAGATTPPGHAGPPAQPTAPPPGGSEGPLVTRPAQALIDELGITPEQVAALGLAVVKRSHIESLHAGPPVTAAASPVQAAPPGDEPVAAAVLGERVELSRVQRGVARAVRLSQRTIPAAYTVVQMDLGPALGYAARVTRQVRRPVGLAELFVREVAGLHADFPRFFAAVDPEGEFATLAGAPHVGVTVDVGEGLYVPCVRDAGERSLGEIATQLMKYRIAAATGGFRERDLTGANFVVTLHTDADVVLAVPFVLPGTVCALAVTSPVDGAGANIGLAYDHRLVNGRDASLFLHALKKSMEGLTS